MQSEPEDVRATFERLTASWKRDCEVQSSPARIATHPAYRAIIDLGPAVLPMILHDLQGTHAHWFWALQAITGENPVPADAAGSIDLMTEAWLAWGRQRMLL